MAPARAFSILFFLFLMGFAGGVQAWAWQLPLEAAPAQTWLASRYDASHVEILLGNFGTPDNQFLPRFNDLMRAAQPVRSANSPAILSCDPICLAPLPEAEGRELETIIRQHPAPDFAPPPKIALGDGYRLLLGDGYEAEGKVVAITGDSEGDLGVLAEVVPADLPVFGAARENLYIAEPAGSGSPAARTAVSFNQEGAPVRQAIAARLNAKLTEFVTQAEAYIPPGGLQVPPQPPAEQSKRLRTLLAGNYQPSLDVARVTLANGEMRYYVRAEWDVEGKATFAVGAWMGLDYTVTNWNLEQASRCFEDGVFSLQDPGSGTNTFPELDNVVPLGEGRTGLIMMQHSYEWFDLYLAIYDEDGPQPTKLGIAGGG